MTSRAVRSDSVLSQASDHLAYEVWMLDSLARELSAWQYNRGPLQYAVLEAFTLHARALLDFFYLPEPPRHPRADDVIAEDYLRDVLERWHATRPKRSDLLNKVNDRVGKEIAHLTYGRLSVLPIDKGWPAIKIRDELIEILTAFLNLAPPSRIGEKLRAFSPPRSPIQHPFPAVVIQNWTTSLP